MNAIEINLQDGSVENLALIPENAELLLDLILRRNDIVHARLIPDPTPRVSVPSSAVPTAIRACLFAMDAAAKMKGTAHQLVAAPEVAAAIWKQHNEYDDAAQVLAAAQRQQQAEGSSWTPPQLGERHHVPANEDLTEEIYNA